MKTITVSDLLDKNEEYDLQLELLNPGSSLSHTIRHYRVQKHGLAFSGFSQYLDRERIQLIGRTETSYLKTLDAQTCSRIAAQLCSHDLACFILTSGLEPHPAMLQQSTANHLPFLRTSHKTSKFIIQINRLLEDHLTKTATALGVLIDLYGVGILLTGESGIGKSECALDLIQRGHRLIADDVINIRLIPPKTLIGSAPSLLSYHMEIRGLGLINIEDIFGVTAIREQKRLDLVIKLVPWAAYDNSDRLNLEQKTHTILGVTLPSLSLPVSPGRNLVTIIEIAARNHMLAKMGKAPGRKLLDHLANKMGQKAS
ncbi:MAG: HPr(Ser) kinase/phosphatase [Deltaproteobacteria bacterium]|nr:HPr(Ser) kinase/phosphatase [Candidatus Anaeroferrophillus wilburensis]MBN2889462.1 HPr(Ser) kinase/phosphatase [Deltaproteobacteria bacterium]